MLSQLQRDLLPVVAEIDQEARFAFAGAGALIGIGALDRETRDLDFFATAAAHVDELSPRLVATLTAAGFEVEELRSPPASCA